ncbi:Electron transport complex subunit RsxG [Thalassoglobus neptunius]|uniref:Electron transport complex subunit RsxG n=1 Tax=Thalassoglobus neptunius TaxID=1938619 RepID=A0A5C5X2C2_9PLAN|nr:FMN-binding protein [Thalassoglobus neptunius]TWT56978.1 Electron transport complex subunit RsxG [Thalassoglobus neptunius]
MLPSRWWVWGVHGFRVLLFAATLLAIHFHSKTRSQFTEPTQLEVAPERLTQWFSDGVIGEYDAETGLFDVLDASGEVVGHVTMTSPQGDQSIGFSGPTNVLVALDRDLEIVGLDVLQSRDTREHVDVVLGSEEYWNQFLGTKWNDVAELPRVDAVSGATLTSYAIAEALFARAGGSAPRLKFDQSLGLDDVSELFPEAATLTAREDQSSRWDIRNDAGELIGEVVSTSRFAESVIGYQGPSQTLIALDPNGLVIRFVLHDSYDNEPYTSYLNDDWSFPELFSGMTLEQVSSYDLEAEGVEGVSGATWTSMAVARGIIETASQLERLKHESSVPSESRSEWGISARDLWTLGFLVVGTGLAFSPLRGNGWIRVVYQICLVVYLGFINGDLLSQAMLVGWVRHGLPGISAARLIVMAGIAFSVPILTKRNVYCSHLCAYGAIQQLVKNRLPWQISIKKGFRSWVRFLPGVLLAWVAIVTLFDWPFSLVDIEPFDAFVFQIAGTATIAVFVGGLIASLFVPMAYCRYGCPTGGLIEYFRRSRRSDRLGWGDLLSVAVFLFAVSLLISDG